MNIQAKVIRSTDSLIVGQILQGRPAIEQISKGNAKLIEEKRQAISVRKIETR